MNKPKTKKEILDWQKQLSKDELLEVLDLWVQRAQLNLELNARDADIITYSWWPFKNERAYSQIKELIQNQSKK